jgi:hypothetical protein
MVRQAHHERLKIHFSALPSPDMSGLKGLRAEATRID